MPTPITSVREYCTLLAKSKLLPPEEVESLYRKWKEEKGGGDERVDSFRRFLIARRAVTDYQAALVQRGRSDGFFLGGYKILDRIGKGQMGGVYKAVHNFGQLVALKILPASKAKDQHVLGRFQREARLLTQLDHPNVVRAYQVGDSGGVHYIVMEFLEGETLSEVLERRGRLPRPEAVRLMRQALDGLQHLHDRRMVHRDVKPSNMMLTPELAKGKPDTTWDATLKILDIGLGRELFDDDLPEGQIDTQLTDEGSVLGTPDYLAPEQAKDARSADIRADIYSIGGVLYHCLVGRPPFPETNIMTQMLRHATEMPTPLAGFIGDLPAGFQEVMNRFLAKRPDDRYATPEEASEGLKPFASGGAAPTPAKIVPAYRDWLESESQLELPKELRQAISASKPPSPQSVKPGTAVVPVFGLPAQPSTPGAPAPKVSPTKPNAGAPGGTAPAPALKPNPPAPKPAPVPVAPQRPIPIPVPAPVPVAALVADEVDVELVTEPVSGPMPIPVPALVAAERPFWPPDRRDWIMLAAGATGVLAAVGVGYALARLLRRKSDDASE